MFEIVTICGSMRFYPQMIKAAEKLTAEGVIVLMPFVTVAEGEGTDLKGMLDQMHFKKIDMSSSILVVSEGDPPYVGESTKREIEYAKATGKTVYWNAPKLPPVPWEHIRP